MTYDGSSARRKTLLDTFKLGQGMVESDPLKNRDFSIILYKASISSLCLIRIVAMVVIMVKIIVLEIECYIAGFIVGGNMPDVRSGNYNTASK